MGRAEGFERRSRKSKSPPRCPACASALVERGANLFCLNRDGCQPQIVARLSHYASRDALDIETLSEKTVLQLYQAPGGVRARQLYGLTRDQLVGLDRFGPKKADNLVKAIEDSKAPPWTPISTPWAFPAWAARPPGCWPSATAAWRRWPRQGGRNSPRSRTWGEVLAGNIVDFFDDPQNQAQLEALAQAGVKPVWQALPQGGPLEGLSVGGHRHPGGHEPPAGGKDDPGLGRQGRRIGGPAAPAMCWPATIPAASWTRRWPWGVPVLTLEQFRQQFGL